MLHKQKGYASPILHKFTLLNLINENCFHIFAVTSHDKSTSIISVFNSISRLDHFSRMNNTLQTKIKPFPRNLLKVQKHPRNENDTSFCHDQPLSPN